MTKQIKAIFFSTLTTLAMLSSFVSLACAKYEYDPEYEHLAGLRGQGSSSITSVMQEIQNSVPDFQYEGSGSGDGLKVGTKEISNKDFGMTSSLKNPDSATKWTSIRTITWAIDAIGIILKMPASINALFDDNLRPIIDGAQLGLLYDKNPSNDASVNWKNLIVNENIDLSSYQEANTPVIAQGRDGGKRTSGTADGFFHSLAEVANLEKEQLDLNHDYLPRDQQSAEANSAALTSLQGSAQGLTYLSLGYGLKQEQDDSKLKMATIKIANSDKLWIPEMANVADQSYAWTRPFNMIYDVTNTKSKAFANLLLTKVQAILPSLNFFALSESQIATQTITYDLGIPDLDIFEDVTTATLGIEV